jgi:outer membrane lipoprotein
MDISSTSSFMHVAPNRFDAPHRKIPPWNWRPVLLILSLCSGCATSPISEPLRQAAKNQPSFAEISAHPESFKGRMVVLGGEVAQTAKRSNMTEIEVWQQPLDSIDRPENADRSSGRFLVRCHGFPSPAAYSGRRMITVAGEIQGKAMKKREIRPLGQFRYSYPAVGYPVIGCQQVQLWPTPPSTPYANPVPYWTTSPHPYYYDPFRRPY